MCTTRLGGWWIVPLLSAVSLAATSSDLRLIEAAKNEDTVAVRALLKQGVDVSAVWGDGATALHWAAHWDNQEIADLLIRAGANVNAANDLGITPLWLAGTNGSTPLIATLLKAGADPNLVPSTGGTPLMLVSRRGNAEATNLLLAHAANVNAKESSHGQTALMWAVAQQRTEVVRVLLRHGADVRARSNTWRQVAVICCPAFNGDADGIVEVDQGGFTPLLFAARYGDLDSARLLLEAGASVDDTAPAGSTALVVAAHSGHGSLAAFLLDEGADPNADGAGYTALHAAVLRGDLDLAKALLLRGADPNARLANGTPARRSAGDFAFHKSLVGATAFLLAATFLEVDIMHVLAATGADTLATLPNGTTPLLAAAQADGVRGRARIKGATGQLDQLTLEAVKLAIDLGSDVTATNQAGDTALHIAAAKKVNAVIQLLADRGANLDVKNKNGRTPLAMATMARELPKGAFDIGAVPIAAGGRNSTADLLRQLGATQ